MELEDLQKTWNQYSFRADKNKLDEETIRGLLMKRTKSLIEKIDRNIRIGISILFVFILFSTLGDCVISPWLNSQNIEIPIWLLYLDILTYLVIITPFIYFVYRYYQVKKEISVVQSLKHTISSIINILNIYRRQFYFAIIILLITTTSAFITGICTSIIYSTNQDITLVGEIELKYLIFKITIGLIVLLILSVGIFLFFTWGFNRLYGNYLNKLKQMLSELNEIN